MNATAIPTPRFPQELIELFIDSLSERIVGDDVIRRNTLYACTQVSRSFSHRARHQLFHKIKLDDDLNHDISGRLSSFHELLSWPSNPNPRLRRMGIGRLTQYVKEFAFHVSNTEMGVDQVMLEYDKAGALTSILNALHGPDHGITKFVLFVHSPSVDYMHLSHNLRDAFLALIRSPRLRYLRICNLNSLPTNFLVNSHIKHLHLYECMAAEKITVYPTAYPVKLSSYPQLDFLDTDHELPLTYFENPNPSQSMAWSSSLTHLRTVSLALLVASDFDNVLAILSRVEDTLEHLNLRYYVIESPLAPGKFFDLTRHPNLRHLCLYHGGGLTLSPGPGLALDDFNLLLDVVELPPSLTTLELIGVMDGEHNTPRLFLDSFLPDQDYRWATLDSVLSAPTFSSVRKLILTFHFEESAIDKQPDEFPFPKRVKSLLKANLPAMSAKKALNLVINVVFSKRQEMWTPRMVGDLGANGDGDD